MSPIVTEAPVRGGERGHTPRALQTRTRTWLKPLQRFLAIEAASGILLAIATLAALLLANSAWGAAYVAVRDTPLTELFGLVITPHWVIDDVLMSVFFFVVGLEIRRELSIGELSDRKRAALPVIAALGGMLAPAGVYLLVAGGAETRAGWGIPTATDIAFALGVLSMLGTRVPRALRVLLLALAVIDDLGAMIVIAVFYARGIHLEGVAIAVGALLAILGMTRAGVRAPLAYALPAVALWVGTFLAGVHPTIAGVVLGLMTPVVARDDAPSPSERLETLLHPWVAFGVMPLFALANAGVAIGSLPTEGAPLAAMLGVALGLAIGKPIGIVLASGLAVRAKIATVPDGITRRHVIVLGVVGGVGFTMALFVSGLAFEDEVLLQASRAAVMVGSALATVLALALGFTVLPKPSAADRA